MARRRVTLSRDLIDRLHALIEHTAERLRRSDEYRRLGKGLRNEVIVQEALGEAKTMCQRELDGTISTLLAGMVPQVLGASKTEQAIQPLLPGLNLPAWFPVPEPFGFGWRRDKDCSPNNLTTIIEKRNSAAIGYQAETTKYVLLRDTALDRGCDPERPISTVFDDHPNRSPQQPQRPRDLFK